MVTMHCAIQEENRYVSVQKVQSETLIDHVANHQLLDVNPDHVEYMLIVTWPPITKSNASVNQVSLETHILDVDLDLKALAYQIHAAQERYVLYHRQDNRCANVHQVLEEILLDLRVAMATSV